MRKANQQNLNTTPGVLVVEGQDALGNAVRHLDVNAKKRFKTEETIKMHKRHVREIKQQITRYSKDIGAAQELIKKSEEELKTLPEATLGADDVKSKLEAIRNLQWVEKVTLKNDYVVVTTRAGVLKTTFNNRIVYKGGSRVEELLPHPLHLPMPTYELAIMLNNMGGRWDRSEQLQLRLADPTSLTFSPNPNDLGWVTEAHSHWAVNDGAWTPGRGREGHWGGLCLNHYAGILEEAGKKGLAELLNEVVMYLQNSGWAHAYRPKMQWMGMLGFQPYVSQLMRPLMAHESFEDIQADTRRRLPQYLKENNMTEHMYLYGSPADGEQNADLDGRLDELVEGAMAQMERTVTRNANTWRDATAADGLMVQQQAPPQMRVVEFPDDYVVDETGDPF